MHSSFSATGRSALERLPVPPLQMDSIRAGTRKAQIRDRARAFVACAALAIGAVGAASFGTKLYDGVHVWLAGNKAAVEVRSLTLIADPTSSDLRNAISTATFPVIFPTGFASGTRVIRIAFAPAQQPNSVTIEYLNQRTHLTAGFSLIDSSVVDTNGKPLPNGPALPPFGDVYQWQVGGETVIVPKRAISERVASRIRAAMSTGTASASLAATLPMLSNVTILGGSFEAAAVAEAIAPPGSVLIDRGHLRLVSTLVKQRKPMLDSRTIALSNIPTVHGEPDYPKATMAWPNAIAISAPGVRAIDAVLRSTAGVGADCCELLFNTPDASTYWIWEIPMSPSAPVKKYAVDAHTFVVTPLAQH